MTPAAASESEVGSSPSNSSFSTRLPQLQLGVDSTSLGAFKKCPRYYQLSILEGWQIKPESGWPQQWSTAVDLQFGLLMHEGREIYEDLRAGKPSLSADNRLKLDHEPALELTLQWALKATWDNPSQRAWASGDGIKNRFTLVRTLAAYLDKYQDDPLRTVQLTDGNPAIEHSFRFPSGLRSRLTGEDFLLCGHLDKVGRYEDSWWLSDLKTTRSQLGRWYVETFSPDNQFSLYILAGQIVLPVKVRGLMLDAVQVLASGQRFERYPIQRTQAELAEWLSGLEWWLGQLESAIERLVERGHDFPMNDKACFRCEFRGVCSKPPGSRQGELERGFRKRQWDPLQARGE